MIASCLKPSLNSANGMIRLSNTRKLSEKKRNQSLFKPLLASFCFLVCIAFIPEKPTNLASICEKHNPELACQVW